MVAAPLVTLALCQSILPGMAARRIESQLGPRTVDVDASVSAFPAIKLLWNRADEVTLRIRSMRPRPSGRPGDLADLLNRTRAATRLQAHVDQFKIRGITLYDVVLRKRGSSLTARALAHRRPRGESAFGKIALTAANGAPKVVQSESLLGRRITWRSTVEVSRGAIVLSPEQPIVRLLALTVFGDPRIAVKSIEQRTTSAGYRLTASGSLL